MHCYTPSPSGKKKSEHVPPRMVSNNTLRSNLDCNSKKGLQQHTQNQKDLSEIITHMIGDLEICSFLGVQTPQNEYPVLEQSVQTVFKRQVAQLVTRTGLVGWKTCYRLRLTFTLLQI